MATDTQAYLVIALNNGLNNAAASLMPDNGQLLINSSQVAMAAIKVS